MLTELRVRNLATVADVTLSLGAGLNVLTGETGAGKSMLVDALALLLGERADTQALRPGTRRAVVEGVVDGIAGPLARKVEALGLDVDDRRLVIRREIATEGRSRAWVNGSPTTVRVLGQLGCLLADLHGQHDTQSLLRSEVQRDLLDAYAEAGAERSAVAEAHRNLATIRAEHRDLCARRDEVRRRADYLRHVVHEIEGAAVVEGEDESLRREVALLGQIDAIEGLARAVAGALDDGEGTAMHALALADRSVSNLERLDSEVSPWRELLDGAYANLSELARVVDQYLAAIDHSPQRLVEAQGRLDVLGGLRQKYGETLAAVRETLETSRGELELLDTAELDLAALDARCHAATETLTAAADRLTLKRTAAADRLGQAVNRLLPELGLPGGAVTIDLGPLEEPGICGRESVTFRASLNEGMEPRPLGRVASGGELSRIMLALKVVLTRHDSVATLVFDEVDQGIGGEVGVQVGRALARVARDRQVLVVTHLPQIAARADRHLVVSKGATDGMAASDVAVIHGEDRVLEVARMLGDADGEAARRHARELVGAVGSDQ